MVAISRTAAAGIAVLSALNHVAATSAPAGDASSNEARDVLNESSEAVALDARDFGDDVPETRDLMEGADPELNKRLLPLIGLGAKLGAKAGAKAAAKKAAKKAARKGAKKGGSEGAKHQHQMNQNKKNNKKKGRRSLEDDDTLEVRDVLEPLEFEIRDLMESGDPELNKRLLPLIGLGAKLGAKAGAKAAAKKAAKKAARKGAKKGGSEGAKHQHQKNQNKKNNKNNKKKGRRSFDDDELSERDYEDELYERDFDDDYFLEARDILGDVSDSFETRAVRPKGGMSRASRHKGSPSMRPGAGRGRPSRGGARFSSFLKPMRKGASPRSFDDAAEFFEE